MDRRLATPLAVVLVAFAAAPASAQTRTVSFDDLPAGTPVTDQYRASHGVYFRGYAAGDGWFPVVRSAIGQARSGANVADVSTCTESNCEGFTPSSTGRLTSFARSVAVYVGYLSGDSPPPSPPPTAEITLTALHASGAAIGSQSAVVTQGQPFSQRLSVTTTSPEADIAAFKVEGPTYTGGIAMDDLSITLPDPASEPRQNPDFSIAVASDPVNLPEGDSANAPVFVNRLNGSTGDIALSASNLPSGVTATFTPNPLPGTDSEATMTLTAAPNAPTSVNYTEITITGTPSPTAGTEPRSATKLMRVVGNCVRQVRADYIDARATNCMRAQGPDVVVTEGQPLRLNGLLLEPQDDPGKLIINTRERTISSDGGEVRVSPADHTRAELYEGEIDWNLGGAGDRPKQVIDSDSITAVSAGGEEPLVDLFFLFRVKRTVVSLTRAGLAEVDPTLEFGFWPFNYLGKKTTTATTGFTTSNDRGSDFSGLTFGIDQITALGIELKDVSLGYRAGGSLTGGATAVLRFGKPYEVKGAFGLHRGDFDHLRASVSGLNTPVSAGIFLQRLGFEVQRSPLSLQGSAAFSAGPEIRGVQPVTVNGNFRAVLDDPFVVELNGTANLVEKYFGDRFQLGSAFVRYTSTGLFELGGDQNWDLLVAYANGRIRGFVDGLNAFSLEGSERVCVRVPVFEDPCAGADMIVSNIGIAACVEAFFRAGIGYDWGGDADLWWGSCDLGPWRPVVGGTARAAAARRFTLRRGLSRAAFAVDGQGAAPGVTLTGPRGEKVSVSTTTPRAQSGRLSAVQTEAGTTYLLVERPSPGAWTIDDDGAVPIRGIRRALGIPPASVKARVSGKGRRRTVRWRLRPIAGQRIKLVETGRDVWRVIATPTTRRGARRFRPADGPGGRRRIVALVEQNGRPRATIVAGSYVAPPPPRPGKPRRARIRRRGSSLVVRWRAPQPGFRHAVSLNLGDGRRLLRVAPPRARSVRVPAVPRHVVATATITGLTHANGRGPSARVAARGAPPRPAGGRWSVSPAFGVSGGRFAIRRGFVSALRLTPAPDESDAACGTGEVRVGGRRRISRRTADGRTSWVTRRRVVSGRQAGRRVRGTLEMTFAGRRKGTGELLLPGCRLFFEASRR